MLTPLHTIPLRNERDVVQARQRAREIAAYLGFDNQEQIRLATAASEMARNAFRYARNGKVIFHVALEKPQSLEIVISDSGPGISKLDQVMEGRYKSETGMGIGIIGTRRLMDSFNIQTGEQGTRIVMSKAIPAAAPFLTPARLASIVRKIKEREPESPYEEVERQNQELLKTMEELRQRQEELAVLNRELEDTNRGVVALYAELDERADYLRRASELKSNFLSNVSHEFRTPLNSIISLSRMLLDRLDGELTEEQEKQVRFIADAARSLSELVNDLLDLAKVEAGKVKIRIKDFEVAELFSALKGMLKPLLADNTSVDLIFENASAIPALRTDEGKVSQILRNFISNAIKFTPQGEVRVSARLHDSAFVIFAVQDTGIGIAPEHQETIFQEFTQIENPLQERYRGTGLGLPLCRNLATLLGGKVWVESELDRGSTFYVQVPLVYSGEAENLESASGVPLAEFHRFPVLLIEDTAEAFATLEPHFRKSEFQLVHADSLERAARWLVRNVPTAIVSNMNLSGSPATDFFKIYKDSRKGEAVVPPIVAVSAYDEAPKALLSGADVFFRKPYDPALLLRELRRLTRREQPRRLLLVDDNEISMYILRQLLDLPWLNLVEARTGQQALALVLQNPPDAVILDLMMPGMDGLEVLEVLRSREDTKNLPVIVYTSKTLSSEEKRRIDEMGARLVPKSEVASTLSAEVILNSLAGLGVSEPAAVS